MRAERAFFSVVQGIFCRPPNIPTTQSSRRLHNRNFYHPTVHPIRRRCASNRVRLSGMTLEALRLRVANRQRAKERAGDGGRETLYPQRPSEGPREHHPKRTTGGTVDTTYKTLLQWQEKVNALIEPLARRGVCVVWLLGCGFIDSFAMNRH